MITSHNDEIQTKNIKFYKENLYKPHEVRHYVIHHAV